MFDEVNDNPAYTVNPALASFYSSKLGTSFDKFSQVDRKIALGHYIIANAINNSIVPANIIEVNQQKVNFQILQQLINSAYVYSSTDIADLNSIAIQCPLSGGNGVYQARITLMTIANDVIEFVDNCDKAPQRSMDATSQNGYTSEGTKYKLFPNPNDGNMTFEYSLSETSSGMFMLYDVTGRLVNSYKLVNGQNNSLQINENELKNGIYFYDVVVDGKTQGRNKIVIVK